MVQSWTYTVRLASKMERPAFELRESIEKDVNKSSDVLCRIFGGFDRFSIVSK